MNIHVVYPQVPETFWNLNHALRFVSRKAGESPLVFLTVAAMLPACTNKYPIPFSLLAG